MNRKGEFRVRSIGELLPPNSMVRVASPESVVKNEPDLKPLDCLELSDDDFVTPIKKCSQNIKNAKRTTAKKAPVSTQKNDTVPKTSGVKCSTTKSQKTSDAQTKLDTYFPTSSHVKMAPRKLKPSESDDEIFSVETKVKRKFQGRKLIQDDEESVNKKKLRRSNRITKPVVTPPEETIDLCSDTDEELENKKCKPPELVRRPRTLNSEKSICPSYKVIEGTTFAVDAFKFGRIEGVTVYFLTHFHADHYIGLTKKFSMPMYVSKITANLMREFIPVDEQFVNIIYVNRTFTIDGVQITPIDANHCPGALMLLFQLPCGKRILHTGDFRASQEMEQNPHLMKKNIDILYLDTTYISNKYSFQSQTKSIFEAIQLIQEFKERNEGKRILFVCGSYLVGKEKFWSQIAKVFDFKVWTDDKRRKVMRAIDNDDILLRLVKTPAEADMHVISLMKIGYKGIHDYWKDYSDQFDMIFAIRPSGWEKKSKPQYRGEVNVIGVEYSEHSSHDELRRFVAFLMPKEVISTVPVGKDQTKCADVPLSWYRKEHFSPIKKQASISDYYKVHRM